MLKAWAIARVMILGRVDASGGPFLARNIGTDKDAVAEGRHYTVRSLLHQTHDQVGVEDCPMLVIDLWLTAAQEIGQVNGYDAYTGQTCRQLLSQELVHVRPFAVAIGIVRRYLG